MAARAKETLKRLGIKNVIVHTGDGSLGWPEAAPYDRIIVTAAAPHVPSALLQQLGPGGILVAPIGDRMEQVLMRYRKRGDVVDEESICRCIFVPLLGKNGFAEEDA